jgi:NADH:ubiquinone oxidoreductase subunit B-like Fe-S oxidoreductase
MYVPGCPPAAEALFFGVLQLLKMFRTTLKKDTKLESVLGATHHTLNQ